MVGTVLGCDLQAVSLYILMAFGPWISRALPRPLEFQGVCCCRSICCWANYVPLLLSGLVIIVGVAAIVQDFEVCFAESSHFMSFLSRCFRAQAKPDPMMPSLHSAALTVKPEWAALIFKGQKTLELRACSARVGPQVWVPILLSGDSCVSGVVQLLGIYSHPNPPRPHRLSHLQSMWSKLKCGDPTSCCMFEYRFFKDDR